MKVKFKPNNYLIFLFVILGCQLRDNCKSEYRLIKNKQNKEMRNFKIIPIENILESFNSSINSPYSNFVNFDLAYCEYINGRISLFRTEESWALVFEKLGFNFRSGDPVFFEIYYFGNNLKNLPIENGIISNYSIHAIDNNIYESILAGSSTVNFNGKIIENIPLDKKEYYKAKIPLEYGTEKVYEGAVLRYISNTNKDLLYASDNILRTCLPSDAVKIMVIDEWYHETYQQYEPKVKPSDQSFYQNIAAVLSTGDTSLFLAPEKTNTHWKYWLDSGNL